MNKLTKGVIMNKLNKIGISALCGSLAAFSAATAGELTVTGGADLTYFLIDPLIFIILIFTIMIFPY